MTGAILRLQRSSLEYHVREAIKDLADATEGLTLTIEGVEDNIGQMPASADGRELKKAGNTCRAAADRILSLALEVARAGGIFELASAVHAAAVDADETKS